MQYGQSARCGGKKRKNPKVYCALAMEGVSSSIIYSVVSKSVLRSPPVGIRSPSRRRSSPASLPAPSAAASRSACAWLCCTCLLSASHDVSRQKESWSPSVPESSSYGRRLGRFETAKHSMKYATGRVLMVSRAFHPEFSTA